MLEQYRLLKRLKRLSILRPAHDAMAESGRSYAKIRFRPAVLAL